VKSYERAARRLMLAYPPRYREYRGDELIATLNDLAEPRQTRPALRIALDVIRSGIALRLREHPRLGAWLGYRLLCRRLPYEYRWWARDDLLENHRTHRILIFGLLLCLPSSVFWMSHGWGALWPSALTTIAGALGLGRLGDERYRRRLLALHEFKPDGTPYPVMPQEEPTSGESSGTAR
jgi:hypothetical protein